MKYPVTIESIQEKINNLNKKIDELNDKRLKNFHNLEDDKQEYTKAHTHSILSGISTPILFLICIACGITTPIGLTLFIPLLFLNAISFSVAIGSLNTIGKDIKNIQKNISEYDKQIKDLSNEKYIEEKRLETIKNQFSNVLEKLYDAEIKQSKNQTEKGDVNEQSRN